MHLTRADFLYSGLGSEYIEMHGALDVKSALKNFNLVQSISD